MARFLPAAEELDDLSSARATINESSSGIHLGHGHAATNMEKQSRVIVYS